MVTWKMAGRPDRSEKKTELTIGLLTIVENLSELSQAREKSDLRNHYTLFF